MGVLRTVVLAVAMLVAAAAPATAQSNETRSFDGRGSAGMDSHVEIYLLEGTYQHRLFAEDGCAATAGVFPAERDPHVYFSEVLQADLAVGVEGRAGPIGAFRLTQPGWATVQVGTGPDCEWTYEIAGAFLAAGREPGPPGALDQPWVLWAALLGASLLVVRAMRNRRAAPPPPTDEPQVRVVDWAD